MDGDGLDLKGTLDLLGRRFWLILVVTAIVLGAAGVALLVLRPIYTATALVLVDPSKKNLLDPDMEAGGSSFDSLRVDSEVELVKSETTLRAVVEHLDLAADAEFGVPPGLFGRLLPAFGNAAPATQTGHEGLAAAIGNLRDNVIVQRRGLTFLIAVSARSGRPELAARIANAIARTYIAQQLDAKVASTLNSAAILKDRMAGASAIVAQSERAFDEFVDHSIARISEATGRTDLAMLRGEIASLNAFRTQSGAVAEQAAQSLTRSDWSAILTGIYELQQTAEIARTQYQTLLARHKDLDIQAYLQVADSRLAAAATPPDTPSFPNPRLILLFAGLAGLGIGIAFAVLVENFVGGFTSAAQAEAILRAPVVSVVPRQRSLRRNGDGTASVADALVLAPLSVYAESIRRVRIGIDRAARQRRQAGSPGGAMGTVVVVSSAAPGEGRTTMALSLARAYALAGTSTLLVDCDLRKPDIHRLLGIEAAEGLLDYLARGAGAADLRAILTIDAASGAKVVVGSRRSEVPTDQLAAGQTLARLIAAARENFEIVVLDTPPLGPVVDGLYLAGMADAIAFVVKFSGTPQQEVKAAMASLRGVTADDVPVLTILNQQTSNPAAYRGKYAGYYAEA